MDLNGKNAGAVTPTKESKSNRSKASEISKQSENFNPNLASAAGLNSLNSPAAIKSATKTQKSANKNPNSISSPSPRNKIRERKFVVARKKSEKEKSNSSTTVTCSKCKVSGGKSHKCLCVAYENLRASQEDFFKHDHHMFDDRPENEVEEEEEKKTLIQNPEIAIGYEGELGGDDNGLGENRLDDEIEPSNELGCVNVKRRREKLLEEARKSVPETGSGKVMHLVKAFEKLLSIPKSKEPDQHDEKESEDEKKGLKWALPGLQQPKAPETQVSSSSFCRSDFFITSESLGLDSHVSSSLDSSQGSFSISSRTSGGGWRSRRNSSESTGSFGGRRSKRRQHKVTSQKPFKLRTEQRGRSKEEEFIKKVQQMMTEEEKQRIPIAQGLPWTTDEAECLAKPPVKESTRPIDLVLHSDIRAVDRAEFDHQVAEKMNLLEQYRMERERQQKLEEEEEIRRLRKELVPRAQPMPYFDRPFIPRRSEKHPTIPKEPRFHQPQHKKIKCCMSWNDMYIHQQ